MRLSLLSLALTLALAGCATPMPPTPASQASGLIELPVETSRSIQLPAPMHYTVPATDRTAGASGKQFDLVAGTYRMYKYNQAGTFYLGEQPAVVERNPGARGAAGTFLRIGGIWIPSDPTAAPKLFILSDYYKRLPDGAPVPQKMTVANLAEYRQRDTRVIAPPSPAVYVPTAIQTALGVFTPLQAGLVAGAVGGVFALIQEPGAANELVFATDGIADPAAVRQIRASFAPGRSYAGL